MSYGTPGIPLISGQPPASVPFSQPKNIFRYGEQSLWSTQFHGINDLIQNGTFRLFSVSIGEVGQGSIRPHSIAETNLKEGGRIPNGVAFDVFGIAAQVLAGDTQDDAASSLDATISADTSAGGAGGIASVAMLTNIINNASLAWDFTQTQVDIAPMHLIGAGGGAFGAYATDNAAAAAELTSGTVSNGAGQIWMYRKHPVALPGSTTFSILLRYGLRAEDPANNDRLTAIRVVLFGYYKNVIEIG